MARTMRVGVHGRARRHIVAMGGIFAERFNAPGGGDLIAQDRFLSLLLRNDAITEEQLHEAIESYRRDPRDYAWILQLRHTILDKADRVFFVRHKRFPTKSSDFTVSGRYHQICQTLQYDLAGFDEELKKLAWDVDGDPRLVKAPPEVRATAETETARKGNRWAFAAIILASLVSAIGLALLITYPPMPTLPPAALAVGIGWMVLLACGLLATRPRQVETSVVHHACSECSGALDAVPAVTYCPHCGVRFEKPSQ